jgi:hypothetical protein
MLDVLRSVCRPPTSEQKTADLEQLASGKELVVTAVVSFKNKER